MNSPFHQTGLLVAAIQAENSKKQPDEESMGHSVVHPALRDRLMLQAGQIMITMGEKLTEIGTKDNLPSQDLA